MVAKVAFHHLKEKARPSGGYAAWSAGTIQGKEGGIQVLASLAPSSQTVAFIIEDPGGATKGGS